MVSSKPGQHRKTLSQKNELENPKNLTLKFHLNPVRMTEIIKQKTAHDGEDAGRVWSLKPLATPIMPSNVPIVKHGALGFNACSAKSRAWSYFDPGPHYSPVPVLELGYSLSTTVYWNDIIFFVN